MRVRDGDCLPAVRVNLLRLATVGRMRVDFAASLFAICTCESPQHLPALGQCAIVGTSAGFAAPCALCSFISR